MPRHLRLVISAGEPLQITGPIAKLFGELPDCVLCNEYGPAETHVVTALELRSPATTTPSPTILASSAIAKRC